jgi:hypothetical protein
MMSDATRTLQGLMRCSLSQHVNSHFSQLFCTSSTNLRRIRSSREVAVFRAAGHGTADKAPSTGRVRLIGSGADRQSDDWRRRARFSPVLLFVGVCGSASQLCSARHVRRLAAWRRLYIFVPSHPTRRRPSCYSHTTSAPAPHIPSGLGSLIYDIRWRCWIPRLSRAWSPPLKGPGGVNVCGLRMSPREGARGGMEGWVREIENGVVGSRRMGWGGEEGRL